MKYYTQNGAYIIQCDVNEFSIELWDKAKKNIPEKNITNANYFGGYDERDNGKKVHFTLPAGSLIADVKTTEKWVNHYMNERGKIVNGKFIYDSSKFNYQNQFYGKKQTTFYIENGKGNFIETGGVQNNWSYAIIGVPLIRNGRETKWYNECIPQGWKTDVIYATQHILLGMKQNDTHIYIISWKSTTSNMVYSSEAYKKFYQMGFYNLIKLDGGGSAMMRVNGNIVQATAENRQCNGYFVIHPKTTNTSDNVSNILNNTKVLQVNPYLIPNRVLRYGSKGNDVKWLQWQLVNKANIKTDIDGSFGNSTRTSVITYQKRNGLDPDGIVGLITRKSLQNS